MEFQIRLTDKSGHGSFLYFNATNETKEEIACAKANEFIQEQYQKDKLYRSFFREPYKPFKTITVVEYDLEKKGKKRNGIKFNLRLSYIEIKLQSGERIRNEWYRAVN